MSVLTLIDKLDQSEEFVVFGVYDALSERCHPNWQGHFAFWQNPS